MGKSKRALHWVEGKHPRDDRGRFARKGGAKWFQRVGERAQASFGDLNLGFEPGRGPAGRLETGKGGLIDIGGLSKAAKERYGTDKVNPQSLSVGDHFVKLGAEHVVIGNPTTGRRAGKAVTRVNVRRVADGKEGPLTLDGPVELRPTPPAPSRTGRTPTGSFADELRAELDAPKDTAKIFGAPTGRDTMARRGRSPNGVSERAPAKKPDLPMPSRTNTGPTADNADGGNVPSAPQSPSAKAYDALLATDGPLAVQNKSMRQILEQMEAHGWEIKTHDPNYQVTGAVAPDGRTISIQFISDKKPHITIDRRHNAPNATFKAALAHVVTPTHEEVGSPHVGAAMEKLGMPSLRGKDWHDPGLVSRDRTYKPLEDVQRAMMDRSTGYSGAQSLSAADAAKKLREHAATNRMVADQRADYNRGIHGASYAEDNHTQTMRQRADQFEAVAAELERQHTARQAYETERDRRAALPLDIRPGRSGVKAPAVKRTSSKAKADAERKAKADAFAALTPDQIVEAFSSNPGDALDAYMEKNFGKGSGRETALPPAVGNIAANLKSGDITPEQAAEQMRQWARLHAGMQHQRYLTLAADLLDGTAATRRKDATAARGEISAVRGVAAEGVRDAEARGHIPESRRRALEARVAPTAPKRTLGDAEIVAQHAGVTRAQFDAMPKAQQDTILADLRGARDRNDQVGYTIPSNRTSMGTTIRGTKSAPHVDAAKGKIRELTEIKPEPVDNSIAARRTRLEASTTLSQARSQLAGLTMAQMEELHGGPFYSSWKRDKIVAYLASRAVAAKQLKAMNHDASPESMANALRGSTREQAFAMLDVIDSDQGITKPQLQKIATALGGGRLKGTKAQSLNEVVTLATKGDVPKA